MRLAILSDIHGNPLALDAVLADIQSQGAVDAYWVLGDFTALGYDPVTPVLATWVICSGNRHFENGIPFLYRLQTKSGEGKIGSRYCILMLEQRPSHMKEKRIL